MGSYRGADGAVSLSLLQAFALEPGDVGRERDGGEDGEDDGELHGDCVRVRWPLAGLWVERAEEFRRVAVVG